MNYIKFQVSSQNKASAALIMDIPAQRPRVPPSFDNQSIADARSETITCNQLRLSALSTLNYFKIIVTPAVRSIS